MIPDLEPEPPAAAAAEPKSTIPQLIPVDLVQEGFIGHGGEEAGRVVHAPVHEKEVSNLGRDRVRDPGGRGGLQILELTQDLGGFLSDGDPGRNLAEKRLQAEDRLGHGAEECEIVLDEAAPKAVAELQAEEIRVDRDHLPSVVLSGHHVAESLLLQEYVDALEHLGKADQVKGQLVDLGRRLDLLDDVLGFDQGRVDQVDAGRRESIALGGRSALLQTEHFADPTTLEQSHPGDLVQGFHEAGLDDEILVAGDLSEEGAQVLGGELPEQ